MRLSNGTFKVQFGFDRCWFQGLGSTDKPAYFHDGYKCQELFSALWIWSGVDQFLRWLYLLPTKAQHVLLKGTICITWCNTMPVLVKIYRSYDIAISHQLPLPYISFWVSILTVNEKVLLTIPKLLTWVIYKAIFDF